MSRNSGDEEVSYSRHFKRESQSRTAVMLIVLALFVTMCVFSAHTKHTDKTVIQAFPGENCTLICSTGDKRLTDSMGVYWTRNGQEWPNYLIFYRGSVDDSNQDPRFQNRLDFADPDLNDNNFSIILQNVSANDSGLYECKLIQGGRTFEVQTINSIRLTVTEPENVVPDLQMDADPDKKNLWLVVGLPVTAGFFLVAAAVALGVFLFNPLRALRNGVPQPAVDSVLVEL